MQILGSPDPLRSTACRTHITPGHDPHKPTMPGPCPNRGRGRGRTRACQVSDQQLGSFVATSGQEPWPPVDSSAATLPVFHGRRHPLLPSRSRNFTGTIEPKGEA